MKDTLLKEVHLLKEEFLADLKKLMQIESVKSEAVSGAPFGVGPKTALLQMLEIAGRLGFETKIVADAVGYVQLGVGDDYIGVIGHLDVVPAGNLKEWDYPPFDLTVMDERLYGRGILDNKGPTMACLYALYVLKRLEVSPSKPIRVLFGTDEESGSADIKRYLEHEKPPVFGFTPDCKYPVVYGEMGYLNLTLSWQLMDGSERYLENLQVDAHASKIPSQLILDWINPISGDVLRVEEKGINAPSNAPELGENAILKFASRLKDKKPDTELCQVFNWIDEKFNQEGTGSAFGFKKRVMLVPYDIRLNEQTLELDVVIRYDVRLTQDEILAHIDEHMGFGDVHTQEVRINKAIPSVVVDPLIPEISTLRKVYEVLTHLDGTPVTTTGATYARWMPNVVAFGPSFPGQKGIAHLPNEWMEINDLMKNFEIYTLAMFELTR